jgi:hypothetical protein
MKTAFRKDDRASARSLKKVKTGLSTRSESPVTIDQNVANQDAMNDDNASTLKSDSDVEIVEVDPEKELGTLLNTFADCLRIHGRALQRL